MRQVVIGHTQKNAKSETRQVKKIYTTAAQFRQRKSKTALKIKTAHAPRTGEMAICLRSSPRRLYGHGPKVNAAAPQVLSTTSTFIIDESPRTEFQQSARNSLWCGIYANSTAMCFKCFAKTQSASTRTLHKSLCAHYFLKVGGVVMSVSRN